MAKKAKYDHLPIAALTTYSWKIALTTKTMIIAKDLFTLFFINTKYTCLISQ